ncbi:MAG: 23S rRNA (guanosine(2251)-2'-O)-methyltransferase RlmB [Candidatus Omnitrophota bacterium]|jgi:23S rRNA (guanosine2251-2'-O)-methyltransferase
MYLYGKRSINERLLVNPRSVKQVILEHGGGRVPEVAALARSKRIPVELIHTTRFKSITRGIHSQGIIAEVEDFAYADLDEIIGVENTKKPTLILLDRINDPQNLGAILRTCACMGGFCVVLPKHECVDVTETVLKVACGAENYVPVCLLSTLAVAVDKAKEEGYWIAATVVEGGDNPRGTAINFPLALVFGSEGEGVRAGLLKELDYRFTLPMQGAELSLNVANAVSIFCYEITCQRNLNENKKSA